MRPEPVFEHGLPVEFHGHPAYRYDPERVAHLLARFDELRATVGTPAAWRVSGDICGQTITGRDEAITDAPFRCDNALPPNTIMASEGD